MYILWHLGNMDRKIVELKLREEQDQMLDHGRKIKE